MTNGNAQTINTELMDYVALAMPLLKQRDENAWELGDIICEAVDTLGITVKVGRKKAGDDEMTMGDLASALNQPPPRVSEWHKNAVFFPDQHRPHNSRAFEDLSWAMFNLARRKSGDNLDTALVLLAHAVRLHMGYNAFKRFLNGEIWEGFLDYDQLPSQVQPYATKPDIQVWGVFKYVDDAIGED